MEISPANDLTEFVIPKQVFEWKRFDTESELQDYIRRDSGEPLRLPPYSLSPEQSAQIEEESARKVSQVTEEFRRFSEFDPSWRENKPKGKFGTFKTIMYNLQRDVLKDNRIVQGIIITLNWSRHEVANSNA